MLDAGNVRRHPGSTAGGDQDLGGSHGSVAFDIDRMAAGEAGLAVDQLGAGVLQVADIDAGEPRNLDVLGHQELRPVEPCLSDLPAIAPGRVERF